MRLSRKHALTLCAIWTVSALAVMTNAGAGVYGSNTGVAANNTDQAGFELSNRDGFYADSYTYSLSTQTANPMQIVGYGPTNESQLHEFIGIGYGNACIDVAGCSYGIQMYEDEWNCYGSCAYNATWLNSANYGEYHSYQLQRNYLGSRYGYRAFYDARELVDTFPLFWYGIAGLGAENANGSNGSNPITLNAYYSSAYSHGYGGASTSPPGTMNMSPYYSLPPTGFSSDIGCSVTVESQPGTFYVGGRC